MGKLSSRQALFVVEYLVDLNSTQACIRAGYAPKHADVTGPRLLGMVGIQTAIQAALAKRSERTEITADRVLRELAVIGFSDPGDILDFTGPVPRLKPSNEITERARRSIASIKVKRSVEGFGDDASPVEVIEFRFWDKPSTLVQLGKHTGVLLDKLKVEGDVTLKIVEEIVDGRTDKNDPSAPGTSGVSGE